MLASTKPRFPLALWFAIEALCIVAYAAKPSPYRWAYFMPILGLVIYSILCTKIIMNQPFSTMGVGSRLFTMLLYASTNILLSDPQRELRIIGEKEDVSDRTLPSRLWWGIQLWANPRGIGWSQEPRSCIPPRPTIKSRWLFIAHQLFWMAVTFFIFDLVGLINSINPYYSTPGPTIVGYQWLWRLGSPLYAIDILTMLTMQGHLFSILPILLGLSEPRNWPPLFDPYFQKAYTIRGFWGNTWHQMFRRSFQVHASFVANALHLPKGTKFTKLVKLLATFIISSSIHYAGDYAMMEDWSKTGSVIFFMLQFVAIIIEDTFLDLAFSFGVRKSTWLTKFCGYCWVFLWFSWTLPYWMDTHYRFGYREHMPRFSVILGVIRGQWFWI